MSGCARWFRCASSRHPGTSYRKSNPGLPDDRQWTIDGSPSSIVHRLSPAIHNAEAAMQYLCLVYQEEAKLDALPASEYDDLVREVLDYREELRQSGHYIVSSPLQPVHAATS